MESKLNKLKVIDQTLKISRVPRHVNNDYLGYWEEPGMLRVWRFFAPPYKPGRINISDIPTNFALVNISAILDTLAEYEKFSIFFNYKGRVTFNDTVSKTSLTIQVYPREGELHLISAVSCHTPIIITKRLNVFIKKNSVNIIFANDDGEVTSLTNIALKEQYEGIN